MLNHSWEVIFCFILPQKNQKGQLLSTLKKLKEIENEVEKLYRIKIKRYFQMQSGLSSDALKEFDSTFKGVDSDADGKLTLQQTLKLFSALSISIDKKEIGLILGETGDAALYKYEDVLELYQNKVNEQSVLANKNTLPAGYENANPDALAVMTLSAFRKLAKLMQKKLPADSELEAWFNELDDDNDGILNFPQCQTLFSKLEAQ